MWNVYLPARVTGGVFRDDNILEKSGGTHSMVTFSCPGMVCSLLFSGLRGKNKRKSCLKFTNSCAKTGKIYT